MFTSYSLRSSASNDLASGCSSFLIFYDANSSFGLRIHWDLRRDEYCKKLGVVPVIRHFLKILGKIGYV